MGRKRIRGVKPKDKLGEPVELDKCPECLEHPDCFSWFDGRCTALKETNPEGCVFYCPEKKAISEAKAAYRKLRESGRFDLIEKYIKPLTAIGALDDEMDEFEREADELENFMNADFEAQVEQLTGYCD